MKGKLDKLPVAHSDGAMLDSMRTILNVYEQLKEIGAKDCFDGSVVASMIRKLPNARKELDRGSIRSSPRDGLSTPYR